MKRYGEEQHSAARRQNASDLKTLNMQTTFSPYNLSNLNLREKPIVFQPQNPRHYLRFDAGVLSRTEGLLVMLLA